MLLRDYFTWPYKYLFQPGLVKWIITKLGMDRTDIFGNVNMSWSCCLSPIWLQIRWSETRKKLFLLFLNTFSCFRDSRPFPLFLIWFSLLVNYLLLFGYQILFVTASCSESVEGRGRFQNCYMWGWNIKCVLKFYSICINVFQFYSFQITFLLITWKYIWFQNLTYKRNSVSSHYLLRLWRVGVLSS